MTCDRVHPTPILEKTGPGIRLPTLAKFKIAKKSTDLKVNILFLINNYNLPPLKWKLGEIITVHPGSD